MQISSYNEFKTKILLESVEQLFGNVQGKECMLSVLCFDFKIAWHFMKTDYYYRCLSSVNSLELISLLPE